MEDRQAENRGSWVVLGGELKRRREAKGVRLDAMAQRLGVDCAELEGLESGAGTVDPFLAERVAGMLGCALSFALIDRAPEEQAEPVDSLSQAIWPV